jgi:hypothetical protein
MTPDIVGHGFGNGSNGAGKGGSVADRDTDSIPAAQGSPPAWRWNDMLLLSQESDSPICR